VKLSGKVVLVSGGARGLGAAHGRVLCGHGASVVLGDLRDDEGALVAKGIGDEARYVHLDVTEERSWAAAIEFAISTFGRLDGLVNNAGICPSVPLLETALEDYRRVLDVNLVGPFLGIKTAAPAIASTGGGSIVNIGSIEGHRGVENLSGYVSSKFGLQGLTRTAAIELAAQKIRVNTINPGAIDTPMVWEAGGALLQDEAKAEVLDWLNKMAPWGRIATADEVAEASAYFLSDAAQFVTGADLTIDGGLTAGAKFS